MRRMTVRRMIVMIAVPAGLCLGLPPTMSAAYAASAAPAMHAAPGVPASAKAATAGTARPGSRKTLTITWEDCTNTNPHPTWVHLDVLTGVGLVDWCYGGNGIVNLSGITVTHLCTGNNTGTYAYVQNRQVKSFEFDAGQDYAFASGITAYSLRIASWSGSSGCVS